jgi:hypothetical protein
MVSSFEMIFRIKFEFSFPHGCYMSCSSYSPDLVILIILGDRLLLRQEVVISSSSKALRDYGVTVWNSTFQTAVCILCIPSRCTMRSAYTHKNTATRFKARKYWACKKIESDDMGVAITLPTCYFELRGSTRGWVTSYHPPRSSQQIPSNRLWLHFSAALHTRVSILFGILKNGSVGVAWVCGLDGQKSGFDSTQGKGLFSSQFPDRLWGPPSILCNWYRGSFSGGKAAWGWRSPRSAEVKNGAAIPLLLRGVVLN